MVFATGCQCNAKERGDGDQKGKTQQAVGGEGPTNRSHIATPERLDLPPPSGVPLGDPEHTVDLSGQASQKPPGLDVPRGPCPPEMVSVMGAFCIDRYEVRLVDQVGDRPLSPYYPPDPNRVGELLSFWTRQAPRSRMALGRSLPVPDPPAFQLTERFQPRAQSLPDVVPSGYLSQNSADLACRGSGKRLCTLGEWVRACKGEEETRFPYGESYRAGVCNVHRESHPAALLHGNSSENHTDPRLGMTSDAAGPLLRRTGETEECKSRWAGDAIYDMVGNLDEWVAEEGGSFAGGFYSRATREGCDALIDTHSPSYFDYSLGTRCCLSP